MGPARQRVQTFELIGRRAAQQHPVDAYDGRRSLGLVATILLNRDIQLNPVGAEASVQAIAEQGGIPVPHIHATCLDKSYVGGPFFRFRSSRR